MIALDMNVLIRLKNINFYTPKTDQEIKEKRFISRTDKLIYIPKKEAYDELNKLIKAISQELWNDERANFLYHTEMLLFAIADRAIYQDITKRLSLNIK